MNQRAPNPPTLLNWLGLLTLGLVWGASFLAANIALETHGPLTIATSRIGIAALVLLAICTARGLRAPSFRDPLGRRIWWHILVFGIVTNAIPFSLLNWGQTHVTSSFAGTSITMVPLITLPLAHILLKGERLTAAKGLGVSIGFIGVVILLNPQELLTSSGAQWETLARLACFSAAVCYAIGSINTKLCPYVPTLVYSAYGLLIGLISIIPIALFVEGPPTMTSVSASLAMLYLGLFPTALATLLLVWMIQTAGPTFLSLVSYQIPLWAVFFGVVVFSDPLPSSFLMALMLILVGLAISQIRSKRSA